MAKKKKITFHSAYFRSYLQHQADILAKDGLVGWGEADVAAGSPPLMLLLLLHHAFQRLPDPGGINFRAEKLKRCFVVSP